jgi:ABC-type multidrug transport system fused ATPase/permease subunit
VCSSDLIGIARALFTKPKFLVLDEATSALDGGTEENISADINKLKGFTTVVLIAHRLSTVRDADLVLYLEKGEIIASGTFEEVRSIIPDFDRQARLMGL